MGSSKLKKNSAQTPTATRASASIAGKLSAWATTSNYGEDATGSLPATTETISMKQLVAKLAKQRAGLKDDVSHLIQESLKPLETAVGALRDTVGSFQAHLVATETIAGENFERLTTAEATIKALQAQNQTLLDHVDDIENWSHRSNLRIVNIAEGSENGKDPVKFIAELLVECVGPDVFTEPPELERAHRSLATKPKDGKPARPFVVRFLRFQQKEAALRWSRNHEVKFQGSPLRFYPDLSSALARKRADYNGVKQALYKKGVRFRLMHPARLVVTFEAQTFTFDSPEEAQEFYKRRVAKE
ncbi:hypothetical protein NHX12_025940 [Muraenolepis orangiensis]|uniref:L1 transposable element RRM domain-containing protein n=1 Tax=Muraenolepis orangiensis TaxID=630683 RepID=A0A9Q0EGK1_9TELE|nr:hypothetical protein NHX12_025940 [Muraenolepis orangiensis]